MCGRRSCHDADRIHDGFSRLSPAPDTSVEASRGSRDQSRELSLYEAIEQGSHLYPSRSDELVYGQVFLAESCHDDVFTFWRFFGSPRDIRGAIKFNEQLSRILYERGAFSYELVCATTHGLVNSAR